MSRQEFPPKIRLAAWERARGLCECCGVKIRPGNGPHYDHRVPDAVGGGPTLDNCQVLCRSCHGVKTNEEDIPAIAKTKRIRNRHVNAESKRQGFRGWRKFDGTPVYTRQSGR